MFIRSRDLTIHVAIDGPENARPLVLLHSLGTNLHVWDAQVAALAPSYRVIRPDLRGHGLTSCSLRPYGMTQLADDLAGLLEALKIEQAHIGGISLGGLVSQAFATAYPDRVLSLILCSTAMEIAPASLWVERAETVRRQGIATITEAVIARWVTPGFLSSPATAGLAAMLQRTPAEGYAAAAEAIAATNFTTCASRITCPALVLVGDQDTATPLAAAQALHQAIAGSSLIVIKNAAHIPTVEQPDEMTAAILNFLNPAIADYFEAGMVVRRQVLGADQVARATAGITDLDRDFQAFITRTAWGSVWSRPGLDRRTRSLLTIAMMASLGHEEELKLHLRASKNTGATPADVAEVLLQVAIYAGIPAANSALRTAKEIFRERNDLA